MKKLISTSWYTITTQIFPSSLAVSMTTVLSHNGFYYSFLDQVLWANKDTHMYALYIVWYIWHIMHV